MKFFLMGSFIVMILFYQNCAPVHEGGGSADLGSQNNSDSVRLFEETLYPLVSQNCAICHGSSQPPLFATSDSKKSHDTILSSGLVDFSAPGSSRLVTKIQGGHQGISTSLAQDLQRAIEDWATGLASSEGGIPEPLKLEATFKSIHSLILTPKCLGCHSPNGERPAEDYSDYSSTIATGGIVAGNAAGSELYKECNSGEMPIGAPMLSESELTVIKDWINEGALNN